MDTDGEQVERHRSSGPGHEEYNERRLAAGLPPKNGKYSQAAIREGKKTDNFVTDVITSTRGAVDHREHRPKAQAKSNGSALACCYSKGVKEEIRKNHEKRVAADDQQFPPRHDGFHTPQGP